MHENEGFAASLISLHLPFLNQVGNLLFVISPATGPQEGPAEPGVGMCQGGQSRHLLGELLQPVHLTHQVQGRQGRPVPK